MNKKYLFSILAMVVVIPVAGAMAEHWIKTVPLNFLLFGKWFVFSAAGLRLFVAGLQQALNPAFTAKEIFHITGEESLPVVRELGFANICFGLVGIVSLFRPEWRVVSAFASGIYYGLAALLHIIKKPAGANEQFALITDLIIFAGLAACLFA